MASAAQPVKTPRIFEVKNPETKTYGVMVLMPAQLASNYPDKPWGTAIDTIGLSKKESDLYPGYVLVGFEPMKGSADLFWVFEDLTNAPALTTKSKGQESLIPQKFRRQITTTRTKQDVALGTEPTDIAGDLTSSVVEQQDNAGKAVRADTEEIIASDLSPLVGGQTSQWGVLTSSDQIVTEGDAVPHAEGIAEASVRPYGNGKAEESKVLYPTPHATTGVIASISDQDQDPENGIITDIQKILITNSKAAVQAAALRTAGWYVERKGQDQNHTVMIASKIDVTSLPASEISWDSDSISLPDQLVSLGILWSDEEGGGSGFSDDSTSGSAKANASASTSASIAIGLQSGFSGKAIAKVTRTYHYGPPAEVDNVVPYSVQPVTGSVALFSSSQSFSCSISVSADGESISRSSQVGGGGRVIQIGPFLSAGITPTGTGVHALTTDIYSASAAGATTAYAQVTASGSATVTLPTSSPASIASGAVVSRYQTIKKWRLGVWVREVVEVYAP